MYTKKKSSLFLLLKMLSPTALPFLWLLSCTNTHLKKGLIVQCPYTQCASLALQCFDSLSWNERVMSFAQRFLSYSDEVMRGQHNLEFNESPTFTTMSKTCYLSSPNIFPTDVPLTYFCLMAYFNLKLTPVI